MLVAAFLVSTLAARPALAADANKKGAPRGAKPSAPPIKKVTAPPVRTAPDKPSKSIADTTPAEAASAPTPAPADDSKGIQRGERIEFDARLIQGQTAKAGAVYLFQRVNTPLRSMVKERTSFRDKIVRKVFPEEEGSR
jgi:hypothetical protein